MDKNCQRMLANLDNELTRKCYELKKAKQERTLRNCFIWLAALLVVIPVSLVFFGVSFSAFVIPALIFLCAGVTLLSPILFIRKGDMPL
jgi:fatty acid desaturase